MKRVVTLEMAKAHVRDGGSVQDLADGAVITPLARDFIREITKGVGVDNHGPVSRQREEPYVPDYEFRWDPAREPKTEAEIQAFFNSPEIRALKRRMVDIGRRMWEREYTDGNGGNLTIRVGENLVLCTPTLISKGFMSEEDMCLVDLEGRQLAGRLRRTSEVLTHLGIMSRQPKAKACCHAHPPTATAYAVAKVQPPTCLIPEAEVFLGQIGMAAYRTPGTPDNAKVIGEAAMENMAVLMENHGVITWGKDIEDAYWKMENTESYCKTVWIASQLGQELTPITVDQTKDLIALRRSLGMSDKRENWKECELCDNSEFRPGFQSCMVPANTANPETSGQPTAINAEAEALVRAVTAEIMRQMSALDGQPEGRIAT